MAAGATYEPIATTTLSATTTTITFSSIPSTYTDLRLVLVGKNETTAANLTMRFNGDTATNYSVQYLYGDGASATNSRSINQTYFLMTAGGNLNTSQPELYTVDIFSYAGSTYKTYLQTAAEDKNGSGWIENFIGCWRSTAAITSVSFIVQGGSNFAIGTTATLYGIKAA